MFVHMGTWAIASLYKNCLQINAAHGLQLSHGLLDFTNKQKEGGEKGNRIRRRRGPKLPIA